MPEKTWLFCSISFFMSPLSPANTSWCPLKNKNWGKIDRQSFCRQNKFPSEWKIAVTYSMGACSSRGTHEISTVFFSLTHTHTLYFFDVIVLARTEGDKTEPFIKRQGRSEKQSQIWCKASLGSCYFIEDGGQNRRPHPACGPTLTNQTWQSPSLF